MNAKNQEIIKIAVSLFYVEKYEKLIQYMFDIAK